MKFPDTVTVGRFSYSVVVARLYVNDNGDCRERSFFLDHEGRQILINRRFHPALRLRFLDHAINQARRDVGATAAEDCDPRPRVELEWGWDYEGGKVVPGALPVLLSRFTGGDHRNRRIFCPHCGKPYARQRVLAKHVLGVHRDRATVKAMMGTKRTWLMFLARYGPDRQGQKFLRAAK